MMTPGVWHIHRKVKGRAVYTLGEATVAGWRQLLGQLGAGPGGPSHAVVTDVREEMVAYIAGRPYLRRELEMPAAAFHHAGPIPRARGAHRATHSCCTCCLPAGCVGPAAAVQEMGVCKHITLMADVVTLEVPKLMTTLF